MATVTVMGNNPTEALGTFVDRSLLGVHSLLLSADAMKASGMVLNW